MAPPSEEKPKLADVLAVGPVGPLPIVVAGPTVSTVNVLDVAGPVFPAASLARTAKVWLP